MAAGTPPSDGDIAEKLTALRQRRATAAADLAKLADGGDGQLSRTDPDARLLAKHGQIVAGYNVQIAVDDKHKLIVASEVVNDGNDSGQLHAMAQAAKQALGVAALTAVADTGYYNGEALKACEDDAITAYVPPRDPDQRLKEQGRFGIADFRYDAAADLYRCPANAELRPMRGHKRKASGKLVVRYASRQAVCRTCPLHAPCLAANGKLREIERWVHEDVIERHQARMRIAGEDMMRRRKALAEHPFGTLKCRAGYRHFLVRGFAKVRGEWSLMALCYNFSRVLRIVGHDRWRALLAQRAAKPLGWLIVAVLQIYHRATRPGAVPVQQLTRVTFLRIQLKVHDTSQRTYLPSLFARSDKKRTRSSLSLARVRSAPLPRPRDISKYDLHAATTTEEPASNGKQQKPLRCDSPIWPSIRSAKTARSAA